MKKAIATIVNFLRREDGPTAVEYAVMIMLVILACIATIDVFGDTTADTFQTSSDAINAAKNQGN